MKRRNQPPLSPEQKQVQDELNQLNAINNRVNKLRRKFESELDPIQDRIDVLNELQVFLQNYVNLIVDERNTLRIELRAEKEKTKALEEELKEFKKKTTPEPTPEPEKRLPTLEEELKKKD